MPDKILRMDLIRTDGGTQQRAEEHPDKTVEEFAFLVLAKKKLPAVTVFWDGEAYWLADGFLRYLAAKAAQRTSILADIVEGTQRDAILFSCGANAEHGHRRTNEDKHKAVSVLLDDAEWSQWSGRRIAEAAGVSHTFVEDLKRNRSPGNGCQPNSMSDSVQGVIGLHPEPEKRIGRDGKEYTVPPRKKPVVATTCDTDYDGLDIDAVPEEPAPAARPKSGQPVFDDKAVTDLFGKLTRAVNERSKVKGETTAFKVLWALLGDTVTAWYAWQREGEVS